MTMLYGNEYELSVVLVERGRCVVILSDRVLPICDLGVRTGIISSRRVNLTITISRFNCLDDFNSSRVILKKEAVGGDG